jgi:hypothetical protein
MIVQMHRYLQIVIVIFVLVLTFQIFLPVLYTKSRSACTIAPSDKRFRGVVITLIRSTNQSISLTINMIHSVIQFHPTNDSYQYPFLIFHDQNFTSSMRQYILSCILKHNKHIQISFALVDFKTKFEINKGSRLEKPIGYRIMCRFWIYDVFYHPAILHGQYDYLMRMDDDSYFSDDIKKDLFHYMYSQKLDYIYRSIYWEPSTPMDPILNRYLNGTSTTMDCIYNNFFMIRLKWFYESKQVQNFLRELIKDDLMLRQYIGDGCVHAAMLKIDKQVKVEQNNDIPYGHNYHIMPTGLFGWIFHPVQELQEDTHNLCQILTILKGFSGTLTRINMFENKESVRNRKLLDFRDPEKRNLDNSLVKKAFI